MNIDFYKYHGTGNDFILLDNRENQYSYLSKEKIAFACNRRFGIGADGLIMLQSHKEFDFEMRYFNSDGNEASMCGNGGRCIVAFAKKLGVIKNIVSFIATDGIHEARINREDIVELKMHDVEGVNDIIEGYYLDTGSPHYVTLMNNVDNANVYSEGKRIRNLVEHFPEGTNVNFVEVINSNSIKVRTYERGVEDETLSCGTGVIASSLVAFKQGFANKELINIQTKGGKLTVQFKYKEINKFEDIWLNGPAKYVYSGSIAIK